MKKLNVLTLSMIYETFTQNVSKARCCLHQRPQHYKRYLEGEDSRTQT